MKNRIDPDPYTDEELEEELIYAPSTGEDFWED